MRNVSEQSNREERREHVQHFTHRMQFLGYAQEDKALVYKEAKKLFDNIVGHGRTGQCPIFRGICWQRRERETKKLE